MAITTYSELQTAIQSWMARSDLSGSVADFIALAEARLNRELNFTAETDATLTGTANSRTISISSLSIVSPIALFLQDEDDDEVLLTNKPDGTFPYEDDTGEPSIWAIDGTNIDFNCLLDQAYTFRFRYQGRFALSVSSPTNWLLTNHPDIYLAASIVWGGAFTEDDAKIGLYKSILDEGIPSVRKAFQRNKRATLTVDPALTSRGRVYTGDIDW